MRRNPPRFSLGGIKSMMVEGVKDAGGILAGRALTRVIKKLVPITTDTAVKQVAVGIGASLVAGYGVSMLSPRMGRMAFAAGLADTISPFLAGLPVVGTYLGDSFLGDLFLGAYPQMAGIPMTTGPELVPGLSAYPVGMGAYDGDGMY